MVLSHWSFDPTEHGIITPTQKSMCSTGQAEACKACVYIPVQSLGLYTHEDNRFLFFKVDIINGEIQPGYNSRLRECRICQQFTFLWQILISLLYFINNSDSKIGG